MYFELHRCISNYIDVFWITLMYLESQWCIHWVDWNKITQESFSLFFVSCEKAWRNATRPPAKLGSASIRPPFRRSIQRKHRGGDGRLLSLGLAAVCIAKNFGRMSWQRRQNVVIYFKYENLRKCHDNVVKMLPIFLNTKI